LFLMNRNLQLVNNHFFLSRDDEKLSKLRAFCV
jgi:hypothetical protein